MSPSNSPNPEQPQVAAETAADAVRGLVRFLRVLRYRKSVVITCLLVVGLLGALYYFTATRVYQASAELYVQTSGPVWNHSMAPDARRQDLIPTYERLFTSAVVLQGALRELERMPPELRVDFASAPKHDWPEILRANLSAQAVRHTNVIALHYRSQSPAAAQAIVAAVVQSYLDFMTLNHQTVAEEVVTILNDELIELESKMAAKQEEYNQVSQRVRNLGLGDHTTVVHPLVQRAVNLSEALTQITQECVQLEASLTAIQNAVERGASLRQHLVSIEPLVGRELILSTLGLDPQTAEAVHTVQQQLLEDYAALESLSAYFGPTYPDVIEIQRVIASREAFLRDHEAGYHGRLENMPDTQLGPLLSSMVEEKLARARAYENELLRQYEEAETEAVAMHHRMGELAVVASELDRLQKLNESLRNRINGIDISQNQADVRVEVVTEPVAPTQPVSPRLSIVALACLVVGLGGGSLLVYILDLMDDRFRSPEELREQLGVSVLAMVRKLAARDETGADALQVHVAPEAVESEAFRTLRTTLAFSEDDLELVAVTSAEPGDGKTTVLSNLGVSYAQAGRRTLLIDADLRRPGLTRLMDLRGLDGVSQVLRAEDPIEEILPKVVQSTGVPGLHVLPCGRKPPNPAELLSSTRMADLLAWAEEQYDQVLVDCPPVMAASDAAIVGRVVSAMILVVQPEKNHRRTVLRAHDDLASMGVRLVGVVANRIPAEREGGYYGYGSGYGYGYGYGYHDDDDRGVEDAIVAEAAHEEDHSEHLHTAKPPIDPPSTMPRRAA